MLHFSISCKSLIRQVALKGPKGMQSLGPILPMGLLIGYCAMARRLWTILPTVPIPHLIICVCLDTTRSTWPTSDLQQTLIIVSPFILIVSPCILIVVYVYLLWSKYSTLTEVYPCFFLGCKANARV